MVASNTDYLYGVNYKNHKARQFTYLLTEFYI